jgi:hypothetical protein
MEEDIFIYRYENIDWDKFDELYEEVKWEICFIPIVKNNSSTCEPLT